MPDLATAPPAATSAPSAPPPAPSTPASTPAPSSAPAGREQAGADNRAHLKGKIGDLFRAAETPAEPEAVAEPAVEEIIQQTEEQPVVEAEPIAEPMAEAEIVETADDEEVPFESSKPEWLPDDKWKTVYSGYKLARELAKPLDQGGIGFTPTVEESRLFYDAYAERIAMEDDFTAGQPQNAAQFVNRWFGAQENGQPRQNAEMVAEAIPYVLARNNEAAYARLAKPVLDGYRNEMWNRWEAAPMEQQADGSWKPSALKKSLYEAAQAIELDITGKYRTFDPATGKPLQPAADPNRQAIDQEWKRINEARQNLTQAEQNRWAQNTNAKIDEKVQPQIDTALAPLKRISAKAPEQFEAAREKFQKQVTARVKQDAKFSAYVSAWKTAIRSGNPEDQENAIALYDEMTGRAVSSLRRPFLEGWGVTIKQQSGARHAELDKISSTAEPNSAGAPTRQAGLPNAKPPANETAEEKMKRRIREISASASAR